MPVFGSFNRPTGAAVDVRELEYLSALLQTDLPHLRRDGTIRAKDLLIYLRSRYGLVVEMDEALDILLGLGGDCLEEDLDETVLDVEKMELRDQQQALEAAQEKKDRTPAINPILESHIRRRYKEIRETSDEKKLQLEHPSPSKRTPEQFAEDADLDLVQLFSIIIMPTLARAGKEWTMRNVYDIDPGEMPVEDSIKSSSRWTLEYWMETQRLKHKKADVARIQSLRPNPNLIVDVHEILLSAIKDDEQDKAEMARRGGVSFTSSLAQHESSLILNAKLIRRLLECFGEFERAADNELVEEMLQIAVGDRGNGAEPIFDAESFVRALTADMEQWDVGCEDNISTAINDVLGFDTYQEYNNLVQTRREGTNGKKETVDTSGKSNLARQSDVDIELGQSHSIGNESKSLDERTGTGVNIELVTSISAPKENHGEGNLEVPAVRLLRKPTASHIDFVVDSPRFLSYTVFSWVFFVTTALCYMTLFQSLPGVRGSTCRGSDFGCTLASTIWTWLMLALGLVVGGYVIMAPIALANSAAIRSTKITLFSFIWTAICATIPYVLVYLRRKDYEANRLKDIEAQLENAALNPLLEIASEWWFISWMRLTFVMGVLLALLLFLQVPLNTAAAIKWRKDGKIHRWMIAQNIRRSAQIKMAATRKVNDFLANAHSLHPSVGSGSDVMIGSKKLSKIERTMR